MPLLAPSILEVLLGAEDLWQQKTNISATITAVMTTEKMRVTNKVMATAAPTERPVGESVEGYTGKFFSFIFFYTSFTHTQPSVSVWMQPSSHEANMKAVQENQSIPKTVRPDQSNFMLLGCLQ